MTLTEHARSFDCFGGTCRLILAGDGAFGEAAVALDEVQALLLGWHRDFSRFEPDSELSLLNADPATNVPVSPLLARLAQATVHAARVTSGLVDATLVGELEAAGYAASRDGEGTDLRVALSAAPARTAAAGSPDRRWEALSADALAGTVTRPAGLRIDSGGLAKGLFADVLAGLLTSYEWWVVDCCGDVRVGGAAGGRRAVEVDDPFGRGVVHRLSVAGGAVATSGIGRRSWVDAEGRPAHHLLDPSTGRPAFTGLVQVSAIARTALEAEVCSKAALLSGPSGAAAWLPDGGVLVHDDERVEVLAPRPRAPRVRVRRIGSGLRLTDLELAR